MAFRYSTRRMLVVTALAAVLVAALASTGRLVQRLEVDACYQHYMDGVTTRDEARQRFGEVVDTWPDRAQSTPQGNPTLGR